MRKSLVLFAAGAMVLMAPDFLGAQSVDVTSSGENVDLREKIDPKQLHDGSNPIYQSRDGLQLSAKVRDGKVVDWEAQDPTGRQAQISYKSEADNCEVLATYKDRRGKDRVITGRTRCPPAMK